VEKVIWFTGQPGSGKTTLAKELIKKFDHDNIMHIDGDDLRDVLDNKDYSEKGRRKNIQFAIDMAKVMESKDYLVIVSLVSPYRDLRYGNVFYLNTTRKLRKEHWVDSYEQPIKNFTYINTDNPIEECIDEILNVCR
jgi:adenylylsulfate kinase